MTSYWQLTAAFTSVIKFTVAGGAIGAIIGLTGFMSEGDCCQAVAKRYNCSMPDQGYGDDAEYQCTEFFPDLPGCQNDVTCPTQTGTYNVYVPFIGAAIGLAAGAFYNYKKQQIVNQEQTPLYV